MVDALSDDDTAKLFKYFIRLHDINKAFKFAILLKCPRIPGFSSATTVVLAFNKMFLMFH